MNVGEGYRGSVKDKGKNMYSQNIVKKNCLDHVGDDMEDSTILKQFHKDIVASISQKSQDNHILDPGDDIRQ
ncbi:hypothetical protein ACOSP7_018790 [Xanthoceras sorbifolium]